LVVAAICTIQLSVDESPNHFLIAVLEHLGKVRCAADGCVETLRVLRVFAAQRPDGTTFPATIDVSGPDRETSRHTGESAKPLPVGYTEIGIYLPSPTAGLYYGSSTSAPSEPQLESLYAKAVGPALAAPRGAPACVKMYAPNNALERERGRLFR